VAIAVEVFGLDDFAFPSALVTPYFGVDDFQWLNAAAPGPPGGTWRGPDPGRTWRGPDPGRTWRAEPAE
jgi:hypothetical protein